MNSHFILGYGREVSARTRWQRLVYTMPIFGAALEQWIWRPYEISTHGADSPSIFVVAAGGKGKTLLGDSLCEAALAQGALVLLNGGGPLYTYFVRRAARDRMAPERVCLVEPSYRTDDLGSPLLHWLQPLPGYKPEEVVEAFVSDTLTMSHRISSPGPRQADLAYYLFRLLQLEQRPVSDLHTVLYNVPVRQAWIDRCPEKDTREYWQYFTSKLNPNQQATWLSPVANKWSPVLRSPFTSGMFSTTESTVHLERIINTKGMALAVELSSERLGTEVAETLAQVFFSRLKLAILQRASIPPAARVPLTVIVDEYSLIRSTVIPLLYRLVRNMNVTIIVMLQDMSVFDEEQLRAILGSTGTILAMGCGEKEAERLCLELYRPSGTKRKSWKDERYYSPNEEMYQFYDLLSKDKQKPRQAICLVNPKGLFFLKTPERTEPVADPVREAQFKEAVAAFWWARPVHTAH